MNTAMPRLSADASAWIPQAWDGPATSNGTPTNSSSNAANAIASASVPAPAAGSGKFAYLQRVQMVGLGATLLGSVNLTITGLVGGTITIPVPVVAGVLVPNAPLNLDFGATGIKAAAAETAITVSCPALGAGNTSNTVIATGYQL